MDDINSVGSVLKTFLVIFETIQAELGYLVTDMALMEDDTIILETNTLINDVIETIYVFASLPEAQPTNGQILTVTADIYKKYVTTLEDFQQFILSVLTLLIA